MKIKNKIYESGYLWNSFYISGESFYLSCAQFLMTLREVPKIIILPLACQ